jgi:hypothetical protein
MKQTFRSLLKLALYDEDGEEEDEEDEEKTDHDVVPPSKHKLGRP